MNKQYDVGRCGFHVKHQPRFHWPLFAAIILGFCTGVLVTAYFELAPDIWERVSGLL